MATESNSKKLYAPSGSSAWVLSIEFTVNSKSDANNTSSITVKGSIKSGGGSFSSGTSNKLTIYWHDNNTGKDTSLGSTSSSSISSGGSVSKSVTTTVEHKADGTLTGYAIAKWTKNDGNSWTPASGSVQTDSHVLTPTARDSVPTMDASSYTVTKNSPIEIEVFTNRASSSFVHTAKIKIGTKTFAMGNAKSVQNSVIKRYFPGDAEYNAILSASKDSKKLTCTVTLLTYASSSATSPISAAGKTCKCVFNISNTFKPVINSVTVEELNGTLASKSWFSEDKIVSNLSQKKVAINVSAFGSATLTVKVQNGTVTKTASISNGVYYATFNNNELKANKFVVNVTDSRGFTASSSYTGTLINYISPACTSIQVGRTSARDDDGILEIHGQFFHSSVTNEGTTTTNNLYVGYQVGKLYDRNSTYAIGDKAFYNNTLYSCTTAIVSPEPFNQAHWSEVIGNTKIIDTTDSSPLNPPVFDIQSPNLFTYISDSSDYIPNVDYIYNYKVKIIIYDTLYGGMKTYIVDLGSSIPVLWLGERTVRVGGALVSNLYGAQWSKTEGGVTYTGESFMDGNLFKTLCGIEAKTVNFSSSFTNYTTDTNPHFYKFGKIVFCTGKAKPTAEITGGTTRVVMFTAPDGFKPANDISQLCNGSGARVWLLEGMSASGNFTFSRMRTGDTWFNAPTSEWLPFSITYITND